MNPKIDEYDIVEVVGAGSFGTVTRVRSKKDAKDYVWKELDYGKMSEREKQSLVSEVNILRDLSHPHICAYHDRIVDRERTKIYILLEFCEGGDLSQMIKKYKRERRYIEEDFIWKMAAQLISALDKCHGREQMVLHRDMKPANVFLTKDANAKLGDFGLARVVSGNVGMAFTYCGTPYYQSPEQHAGKPYNDKSDVWSLGCLLYELCALTPPFNASNKQALAIKVREGRFRRIPNRYSDALSDLIKSMLQVDPYKRPSIVALRHCPDVERQFRMGVVQKSVVRRASSTSPDGRADDRNRSTPTQAASAVPYIHEDKDCSVEAEVGVCTPIASALPRLMRTPTTTTSSISTPTAVSGTTTSATSTPSTTTTSVTLNGDAPTISASLLAAKSSLTSVFNSQTSSSREREEALRHLLQLVDDQERMVRLRERTLSHREKRLERLEREACIPPASTATAATTTTTTTSTASSNTRRAFGATPAPATATPTRASTDNATVLSAAIAPRSKVTTATTSNKYDYASAPRSRFSAYSRHNPYEDKENVPPSSNIAPPSSVVPVRTYKPSLLTNALRY